MRKSGIAVAFSCVASTALASPVTLACRLKSTTQQADRENSVDRVIIDVAAKRLEATSSSTGDSWVYEDKGVEDNIGYFDALTIHQIGDGRIVVGGIRADSPFAFEYSPATGTLVSTYASRGSAVSITYSCRELK